MTHISPRVPLYIPREIAALPVRLHEEHGSLLLNRDVACLFGVCTATLRRWRARGQFPDVAVQEPTASWYRFDDVVHIYDKFISRKFSPKQAADGCHVGVTECLPRRDAIKGKPISAGEPTVMLTAKGMRQVVREALLDLMEYETENPVLVKQLTETVAQQQALILSLTEEIQQLQASLRCALQA